MLESINVRFFVVAVDPDTLEPDEIETTERQFLKLVEQGAAIEYERNTVFDNGCRQICLGLNTLSYDWPMMDDIETTT